MKKGVASKKATTKKTVTKPAVKKVTSKKAAAPRRPRAGGSNPDGATEVQTAISKMTGTDRVLAEKLHAIIKASAPDLVPRLWYGMPAYSKGPKVVCFFQSAQRFKTRYATLGFMHEAKLDDGRMWPTAFALKELTNDEVARISELVKKAVG